MRSTHTGQTTKQKLGCVCVCVKIDSNEAHTMNGHRYRTTNCAVSARLLSLLCGKPDHDTFWHGKSIENIRIWFYFGLCAACFELQCFLFDLGEKAKIHHIVAYTHTHTHNAEVNCKKKKNVHFLDCCCCGGCWWCCLWLRDRMGSEFIWVFVFVLR